MTKKGGKHPHPHGCRCPIHAGKRGGGGRRSGGYRGAAHVSHAPRKKTLYQMFAHAIDTVKRVAKKVVPTGMVVGGLILPAIDGSSTSGYTAAQSLGNVITGGGGVPRSTSLADAVYNLKTNLRSDWIEAGGLILGGVVAERVLSAT